MIKMFKSIIEFFKNLFKKEDVVEPTVNSGDTTTSAVTTTIPEPQNGEDEPQIDGNEPIVPEDNSGEQNSEPEFVSDFKVLIDNGHGVNTSGKRSPYSANGAKPMIEFYEYKWNREIAAEIVKKLKELKYDAELIVTESNDISLSERAKRVNKICSDLGTDRVILISVHANASGNGTKWMDAQGWCAYTTVGTTKSDKLADFLYDEAEKNFNGRKIRKDNSDGDRDWEANFTVIYKSACPAVLTENFFYDNVDDVKYILSKEGREAVIKTHVDGIINYIKYAEEEKYKLGYHKA